MTAWFLYVLRCGDGSLYTGIATDVVARLAAHAAGRGARYTRGRGPLTIAAKARCRDRSTALKVEYAFKQLSRADKDAVLARPRGLVGFVARRKPGPEARRKLRPSGGAAVPGGPRKRVTPTTRARSRRPPTRP
jgi:putative endonuclease